MFSIQDNPNRSSQNSSTKPCDSFGSIRLTVREIDVVACIVHMRGNSRIASILGISPKTVETHVFNVMRKFDCNSRENIIDFATQSGQSAMLRSHYHSLLVEAFFKKKLQEISILTRNKKLTCQIIYGDRHAQNKSFLATIEDHLALAGVKTILRKREGVEFLCIRQHSESPSGEEPLEMGERIDFEKQDYCLSIFEILGKLLQPLKLDQPVLECEKAYEKLRDSSVETLCRELLPQESDAEGGGNQLTTKSPKGVVSRILETPRTHLLLVFIFLLGACGFVFLGFMGDKSKHQGDKPKVFSIRSDLSIPTEATLLKRSKLLEQIETGLKKQDGIRTVSVIGMGGSGKTTLARQYARSSDAAIVWEINAETRESLLQSFEGLAYALSQATGEENVLQKIGHLQNLKEKEEKIFLFVRDKLKHFSNWVLIYDSVTKMIEIQKYFPSDPGAWGKGVVIVTTRDSTIQNNEHIHDAIHIGELDREEKKALFSKIIANKNGHSSTENPVGDDTKFLEQISPFSLDISPTF